MNSSSYRKSGFTLLEVLIALGLSVVLIFAVYGAIDLLYRYNVAGRGEIGGQQFLRGLNRRIGEDLGCVVFSRPQDAATELSTGQAADDPTVGASSTSSGSSRSSFTSTSNTFGTASASNGESTLSFEGLSEAGTPPIFGVIGSPDLLHLCTSLPNRELSYWAHVDRKTGAERSSDLEVVTYGLVTIDGVTMMSLQKNLTVTRPDQGLGRRTRDLFATDSVDETLASENLLAPEVVELNFLYFDGTDWGDTWDSLSTGTLPRAIEVTFGIWNPPPRRLGRVSPATSGTITRVSHMFYLPLAEPALGGTAQ